MEIIELTKKQKVFCILIAGLIYLTILLISIVAGELVITSEFPTSDSFGTEIIEDGCEKQLQDCGGSLNRNKIVIEMLNAGIRARNEEINKLKGYRIWSWIFLAVIIGMVIKELHGKRKSSRKARK